MPDKYLAPDGRSCEPAPTSAVLYSVAPVSAELASFPYAGSDGRRPVFGHYELFQTDPHDQLWFHEYFHGDTGAGLGAAHQTGWTGLVAECLLYRHHLAG